jgi:hypothetical protein
MFRNLPILGAAALIAAMSVAPASAGGRQVIKNVTVDNSNYSYGWGWTPGVRGLYPDSSLVELYGTAYAVPKHVIAYWPTVGWYRR